MKGIVDGNRIIPFNSYGKLHPWGRKCLELYFDTPDKVFTNNLILYFWVYVVDGIGVDDIAIMVNSMNGRQQYLFCCAV